MLVFARSFPRAAIRLGHKHLTTSDGGGGLNDVGNTTLPLVSKRSRGRGILKRRKSIRPMAGRKNKEGREKAIKDHREVGCPADYAGIHPPPLPPLEYFACYLVLQIHKLLENLLSGCISTCQYPLIRSGIGSDHSNMMVKNRSTSLSVCVACAWQ